MGFFYNKPGKPQAPAKRDSKRIAGASRPRTGQGGRANAATLNRLSCKACPLNHADVLTPKMEPTIPRGKVLAYFLAEAPGRDEDEVSHRPLTGDSGALLRECIPDSVEEHCAFDNTVRNRPPKNRTPEWAEVECCRPNVIKSIEQAKPSIIIGLGAVAMNWALGSTDMAGMRGRLFAVQVGSHKCWFLGTYHPSYVMRTAYDKKRPLNSRYGYCLREDVARGLKFAKLPPPIVDTEADVRKGIECLDGSEPGHFDRLMELLGAVAEITDRVSIDWETSCLRPYSDGAQVLTCSLSFYEGDDQCTFSFAVDHPKARWTKAQRTSILSALKRLLINQKLTKIAHNVPFELEWAIFLFGKEVVIHECWEDTMVQAHILDERRGKLAYGESDSRATYQNLNFLCKQHFGIAIKSLFKKLNKKNMAASDLDETLVYNGADSKYTHRLFHKQEALLKQQGLHDAYLDTLPRQPTVALMQHLGMGVDQAEVKRTGAKLDGEIKGILADIAELKVVKQYAREKGEFNPQSPIDVLAIFRDYLKRPEIAVELTHAKVHDFDKSPQDKKKWDDSPADFRFSTDKAALTQIEHPLAGLILELRNRTKLKSTYSDGLVLGEGKTIYPDGKLHTSFNTTFTETGRTSSDEPNLQNFPKRYDAWIRRQVVPEAGGWLIAADYGQLEACTAAMASKDKVLVKALWEDYDIHMEWAEKIAYKHPPIIGGKKFLTDKKVMKAFRSLIKNKMVFPAIFGAQNDSVHGYLTVATGVAIPESDVDDIMDEFWDTFWELKSWQKRLMKKYYDIGYVEDLTGRRHHYPLNFNQAVNFPIQSVACAIVCDSMNKLSYRACQRQQWHLHPRMNIHDDLTFSVPDKAQVLEESIETIYRAMLTPPYKFINVPMAVEVSIGRNWFDMKDIGKFWSHRDL